MLNGSLCRRRKTALIDQRAVAAGKKNQWQGISSDYIGEQCHSPHPVLKVSDKLGRHEDVGRVGIKYGWRTDSGVDGKEGRDGDLPVVGPGT